MDRKEYLRPDVKVVNVDSTCILNGSTGATGEDVPWSARKVSYDLDLDLDDITENN